MSLIMNESNFQHILRVLNTNLDGKVKVMFALTSIKGVGRRFANIACKKAEVDLNKRCGAPRTRPAALPVARARPWASTAEMRLTLGDAARAEAPNRSRPTDTFPCRAGRAS